MQRLTMILVSLLLSISVSAEVIESITAVVNGSTIKKTDVQKYRERLRAGTIVDDLFGNDSSKLLSDDALLLRQMIDELVVDGEVKKLNLTATIEQVEQEINSIQSRNHISRDQLREALKAEGTGFAEYQNFIKKRLERQSVIARAITSKIKISDEEIIAAYEAKSGSANAMSFEFKVAHILFAEGKRSDAEQLRRAQELYAKLVENMKTKSGDSFETLASKNSEDVNFNEGGYLGTFRAGDFMKPLEEAIRELSPGEITKPIKTKLGYHIVKLLERHAVPDAEFEKQKEGIHNELQQKAFVKQFQFWLEQRRQGSEIRIN